MEKGGGTDLQQQIDELVALVSKGRTDIDALITRADMMDDTVSANRTDIDELQAHVSVDRELIAELQADGDVAREHTEQLQKALATSRTIGAAVGVLMASRNVDQDEALRVLKEASSRSNTPMRRLAEVIVSGPEAETG
jgi:hypothetical protein